jgi:UMF1 family MFS transporter
MKFKRLRDPVFSWALYDWANSSFATTVMAGFFPLFFKQYWSAGVDATLSTFRLGLAVSIGSLTLSFVAPFLGALSDAVPKKKNFLGLFAGIGIIATASLCWIPKGGWTWVTPVYALALIGFSASLIFYDSLLPRLIPEGSPDREKKLNQASALGYSLGYLGGGILFALNVAMFKFPQMFGISDGITAVKLSFLTVSLWWFVFSIPLFLFVREPAVSHKSNSKIFRNVIQKSIHEVLGTLRKIRSKKNIFYFLIAYWLYIDGVDTVISMAVDYGMSIGFGSSDLIAALLLTQFVGFPAAILFGKLGSMWDTRKAIFLGLAIYGFVVFWASQMQAPWEFYFMACLIGLVQGGVQSLSRSFYAQMIPSEQSGEYFGFYNLIGKFAAILGPLIVGVVGHLTSNSRLGIQSLVILFLAGGYFLLKVEKAKFEPKRC